MTGMQAGLSRARHPALFLTTWLVSTVVGCTVALVAVALMPTDVGRNSEGTDVCRPDDDGHPRGHRRVATHHDEPLRGRPDLHRAGLRVRRPVPVGVDTGRDPDGGVGPPQRGPGAQGAMEAVLQRGELHPVRRRCIGGPEPRHMAGDRSPTTSTAGDLGLVVLSWVVYHLVNLAQVAGLAEDQTWWDSFTEDFWFYTVSTGAVLALSPLVAVVAIHPRAWVLLPLLLPPLLAVQRTPRCPRSVSASPRTASIRPCTISSPACPTRPSWPIGSRPGSPGRGAAGSAWSSCSSTSTRSRRSTTDSVTASAIPC